jgi:hypothetical protein
MPLIMPTIGEYPRVSRIWNQAPQMWRSAQVRLSNAISSPAAAAPARLAPIVDAEGP